MSFPKHGRERLLVVVALLLILSFGAAAGPIAECNQVGDARRQMRGSRALIPRIERWRFSIAQTFMQAGDDTRRRSSTTNRQAGSIRITPSFRTILGTRISITG